jgi:pyridoxamine 5'-phosphate oxidase
VPERARPFLEDAAEGDPRRQFELWFDEARAVVAVPEAMALATAGVDGAPSARMVLLKQLDETGFVFYTSYESRKGRELAENPRVALLFHWHSLGRQVRVEGRAESLTREESEAYFRTRPRGVQIGAHASQQSQPIGSRAELDRRHAELAARFEGDDVPLPEFWGGYRVVPEEYEFWQHRDDRLHDRLRYRPVPGGWAIERLQP